MEITENNTNEYHTDFEIEQIDGYVNEGSGVYLLVNNQMIGCDDNPLHVYIDSEDRREYLCLNESIVYLTDLEKKSKSDPFISFVCFRTDKEVTFNVTRMESFEPYKYGTSEHTRVCMFNGGSMVLVVEYGEFKSLIQKWYNS